MAKGIVYIEKEVGGEVWENSYAFVSGDEFGNLDDDALNQIGMDVPITTANTDPASSSWVLADTKLINSIIAFERQLHPDFVNFTKAYVSDGLKNSAPTDIGPLHSVFAVQPLSFNGLSTGQNADQSAPGIVALRASKAPLGFSQKVSNCYYHSVLNSQDVSFKGRELTGFRSPTVKASYVTRWFTFLAASGLDRFIGAGLSGVYIGIGKHSPISIGTTDKNDLIGVRQISNFAVVDVSRRQMKRGKK